MSNTTKTAEYKNINPAELTTTKKVEGYIKASHSAAALHEVSAYCDTKWNAARSEAMQDAWAELSEKAHEKAKALDTPAPKAEEVQTAPKAEEVVTPAAPDMMQTMMQQMQSMMQPMMQTMMQTMMQQMQPMVQTAAEDTKAVEDAKKAEEDKKRKEEKAHEKAKALGLKLWRKTEEAKKELDAAYRADIAELMKNEGLKYSDTFVSSMIEDIRAANGASFARKSSDTNGASNFQKVCNFAKEFGLPEPFEFTYQFKSATDKGQTSNVHWALSGIEKGSKEAEALKNRFPRARFNDCFGQLSEKVWHGFSRNE